MSSLSRNSTKARQMVGTLVLSAISATTITYEAQAQTVDVWLNNGTVKVGQSIAYGGSITYISTAASTVNLVNAADKGRLVQQSYYAGKTLDRRPAGQSPSWSPWPWNPVQGGDAALNPTPVAALNKINNGATIYSECQPLLWDMTTKEKAQARMYQWTEFEPNMPQVIRVRNEFVCSRSSTDPWGGPVVKNQELPAAYFIRNLGKMVAYTGNAPWTNGPLTTINATFPWQRIYPKEPWMACLYPDDTGIAVYSPAADNGWNAGAYGGTSGTALSPATMHMAPIKNLSFDRTSRFSYRYWIILGDISTIRTRIGQLKNLYPTGNSTFTATPTALSSETN